LGASPRGRRPLSGQRRLEITRWPVRLLGVTGDIWSANMDARIKTSSQIAARTNEARPTQEHILDEVHDATHLVRDAVHNAIDDQYSGESQLQQGREGGSVGSRVRAHGISTNRPSGRDVRV
jgi:hypothetical protein